MFNTVGKLIYEMQMFCIDVLVKPVFYKGLSRELDTEEKSDMIKNNFHRLFLNENDVFITKLAEEGMWISAEIKHRILRLAGES